MNYIYCSAETVYISFNVTFPIFCFNILKYGLSFVDTLLRFRENCLLQVLILTKNQF